MNEQQSREVPPVADRTPFGKFIKLGYLQLHVNKECYDLIKVIAEPSKMEPASQDHADINICVITQSPRLFYYTQNYSLAIHRLHGKSADPSVHLGEDIGGHSVVCVGNVESKQRLITEMMNFIDSGRMHLLNPFPLTPEPTVEVDKEGGVWFMDTYQNSCAEPVGLEVWVSEPFLYEMTNRYNQFAEKIAPDEEVVSQINLLKKRSAQFGKGCRDEMNFIRVLRQIYTEDQIKGDRHKAKQRRRQKQKKSLFDLNYDPYNSYKLKPYVCRQEDASSQNISVLNLSQGKQKVDAGLFFDLTINEEVEIKSPPNFMGELKPYQFKALGWMLNREGVEISLGIDMDHVPYWWDAHTDLGFNHKFMVNCQLNFVTWKKKVEKKCNGGILADEMGLGKTIMIIALILSHRPIGDQKTLVIAPVTLVKQWKQQLRKFAPHLRVLVVHQTKLTQIKLNECDVVITTEGKLRFQGKKKEEESLILSQKWFRIVVDEAHIFKNSETAMAKKLYELKADYRWCLTGTPTQNSISDLYSLVKFLQFVPWCYEPIWNSFFPRNSRLVKSQHLLKVKQLLKGILLRRKKNSVEESGEALVKIPKIQVKVHLVKMSEESTAIYSFFDYAAKRKLDKFQELERRSKGTKNVALRRVANAAKNQVYQQILGLLIKMRMICCHQFLSSYKVSYVSNQNFQNEYRQFLAKKNVTRRPRPNFFETYFADSKQKQLYKKRTKHLEKVYENWDEKLHRISLGKKQKCLICDRITYKMVLTPCIHTFCELCVKEDLQRQCESYNMQEVSKFEAQDGKDFKRTPLKQFKGRCPYCEDELNVLQLFDYPSMNQFDRPMEQFVCNQKLIALLQYLRQMKPSQKAVIYTSFLGMLTLIEYALTRQGIPCLTFKGSDSYEARHQTILQFNSNPHLQALIVTLKTGSVGLNLQCANKVFFMDPWWNPGVEDQAIGRVHRIGQSKQVQAVKFITVESIQARIIKMSVMKKEITDSIFDIDDVQAYTKSRKSKFEVKYLLALDESLPEIQISDPSQNEGKENQADAQNQPFNALFDMEQMFNYKHQYIAVDQPEIPLPEQNKSQDEIQINDFP